MSVTFVLVVDDDVAVCRILHRMLSDEQYQVQISHSVADAVAAIEQKFFDVYVLDYKLPDGTGLDVAERIRSKGSQAPVILISGYDPGTVALRAEQLRIFDIIEKPFSRATICEAVKRAIGFSPPPDDQDAKQVSSGPGKRVKTKKSFPKVATIAAILIVLLLLAFCLTFYLYTQGH
jgi:two-component system, NtrC family, response regulator HydG